MQNARDGLKTFSDTALRFKTDLPDGALEVKKHRLKRYFCVSARCSRAWVAQAKSFVGVPMPIGHALTTI
jgi:hypothetical protein